MGNSTCSGQGGDEARSSRDMATPEYSERPPKFTKHETYEAETQSVPQWRPTREAEGNVREMNGSIRGAEAEVATERDQRNLRQDAEVKERLSQDITLERTMCPEVSSGVSTGKTTQPVRRGLWVILLDVRMELSTGPQ